MTENQNDGKTANVPVTPSIPDADEAMQKMLAAAQRHAILVATDGVWWTTRKLGEPVESVEDLGRHLDRLYEYHSYFQPVGGFVFTTDAETGKPRKRFVGEPPQVWVLGDVIDVLGWGVEVRARKGEGAADLRDRTREELAARITETLDPIVGRGWTVIGKPGYFVQLRRDLADGTWYRVTLVNEPYAWLALSDDRGEYGIAGVDGKEGSELPVDDTDARRELTRRLAWSIAHLGVLPSQSPSATGAVILDMDSARKKNAADVVTTATMLPDLPGMTGTSAEPEPVATWALNYLPNSVLYDAEGREADGLIEIDQAASYLASAGMVAVGLGQPAFLEGLDPVAEWIMRQKDTPAGLYRVTLPAGRELVESKGIPDAEYREDAPAGRYLPWPHPAMKADEAVTTWVTAPSIDLLRESVEAGGAGLTLDELNVDAAHVWEREVLALKAWQRKLRDARAVAIETGDTAMLDYIKSIYRGYIGRMKYPKQWAYGGKEHHHQPILRASIIAHARNRGRRWAAKVGQEYDRWPLFTDTDSWVYTWREGDVLWGETWKTRHPEMLRASTRCGSMVVKRSATLAETVPDRLVDLLAADSPRAIAVAADAILEHLPAREPQEVDG